MFLFILKLSQTRLILSNNNFLKRWEKSKLHFRTQYKNTWIERTERQGTNIFHTQNKVNFEGVIVKQILRRRFNTLRKCFPSTQNRELLSIKLPKNHSDQLSIQEIGTSTNREEKFYWKSVHIFCLCNGQFDPVNVILYRIGKIKPKSI